MRVTSPACAAFATLNAASAFMPAANTLTGAVIKSKASALRMSAEGEGRAGIDRRGSSEALPFTDRPDSLSTAALAGDFGFDPLGLAGPTKDRLLFMREAEIRHARIAMIAAAGWPLAELWNSKLATAFKQPSIIQENDGLNPSIPNGGLDKVSPVYWGLILAATAAIELYTLKRKERMGAAYEPGDLGFDPLGFLRGASDEEKRNMQTKELKNGRTAMMGISLFALEEFVTRRNVVSDTPLFFEPVWKFFSDYYADNHAYVQ